MKSVKREFKLLSLKETLKQLLFSKFPTENPNSRENKNKKIEKFKG